MNSTIFALQKYYYTCIKQIGSVAFSPKIRTCSRSRVFRTYLHWKWNLHKAPREWKSRDTITTCQHVRRTATTPLSSPFGVRKCKIQDTWKNVALFDMYHRWIGMNVCAFSKRCHVFMKVLWMSARMKWKGCVLAILMLVYMDQWSKG